MKKRLLSVALVIVMLLSLLPAVALAEGEIPEGGYKLVIDLTQYAGSWPENSPIKVNSLDYTTLNSYYPEPGKVNSYIIPGGTQVQCDEAILPGATEDNWEITGILDDSLTYDEYGASIYVNDYNGFFCVATNGALYFFEFVTDEVIEMLTEDKTLTITYVEPTGEFEVYANSANQNLGTVSVKYLGLDNDKEKYSLLAIPKAFSTFSYWKHGDDSFTDNPLEIAVSQSGESYTAYFSPIQIFFTDENYALDNIIFTGYNFSNLGLDGDSWPLTNTDQSNFPALFTQAAAGQPGCMLIPFDIEKQITGAATLAVQITSGGEPYYSGTVTQPNGLRAATAPRFNVLVIRQDAVPAGMHDYHVTMSLMDGYTALCTIEKDFTAGIELPQADNNDFRYLTSPGVSRNYITYRDDGPDVRGLYGRVNEATGAAELYLYADQGVYALTGDGEKDLVSLGLAIPTGGGVLSLGPCGTDGLTAAVKNNDIAAVHTWDGETWTQLTSVKDDRLNSGGGILVLTDSDIWTPSKHWNGEAWEDHSYGFTSFERVGGDAYAVDADGQRYVYSGGSWTQTAAAETAPAYDVTGVTRRPTTGRDHNGDWYLFTEGKDHYIANSSCYHEKGSFVYKWDGEQWVYQIMSDFNDPNDDPNEQQQRIRPDCVTAIESPMEGVSVMYGDHGAIYLYTDDATITFTSNGGSEVEPLTAPIASKITPPASPTRDGYTFVGWYTLDAFMTNGPSYAFGLMPAKDITLYAKWIEAGSGEDPFAAERERATESLNNEYNKLDQNDYDPDVWAQIEAVYAAGLAGIADATTYDGVYDALNEALAAMGELARQTSGEATVAVTVEKFTVDGEYIVEPVLVTVPKYSQASVVVTDLLKEQFPELNGGVPYTLTGTETDNFYLSGVYYYGADGSEEYLPEKATINGEYYPDSGWLYCVNGEFPGFGADGYALANGDVMRWQFTCVGLGADVGDAYDGEAVQVADKDALIWKIAEINAAGEQDEYPTYADAMAVLKDIPASQEAVDAALAALVKAQPAGPAAQLTSASLTLAGDIGVNFYVIPDDTLKADAEAYAILTYKGEPSDPILLSSAPTKPDEDDASVIRSVFTQFVAAKDMTEQITLRLFTGADEPVALTDANGNPFADDAAVYSVARFVKAASETQSEKYAKLKELAPKIASYGAYAMTYFAGYNDYEPVCQDADYAEYITDAKANVSGISAATLLDYKTVKNGTVDGVEVKTISLTMDSLTTLRIFFTGLEGHTVTVDGTEVTPVKSGSKYVVKIPNIAAKDLGHAYTIAVDDALTLKASALSYARSALNAYEGNPDKADLCNLARALYEYNAAAINYFNA